MNNNNNNKGISMCYGTPTLPYCDNPIGRQRVVPIYPFLEFSGVQLPGTGNVEQPLTSDEISLSLVSACLPSYAEGSISNIRRF